MVLLRFSKPPGWSFRLPGILGSAFGSATAQRVDRDQGAVPRPGSRWNGGTAVRCNRKKLFFNGIRRTLRMFFFYSWHFLFLFFLVTQASCLFLGYFFFFPFFVGTSRQELILRQKLAQALQAHVPARRRRPVLEKDVSTMGGAGPSIYGSRFFFSFFFFFQNP